MRCTKTRRASWKRIILAAGLSVLVLAGLFAVNAYQADSYEYLSTKEVIVKETLAQLDSNEVQYIRETRQAVEMLVQLGAADRINQTAILETLNSTDYAGDIDNVYDCLLTLKALGRLDLMDSLVGNTSTLHTRIISNQYFPGDMPTFIFAAQFFGWTDEMNKTLIANYLQPEVLSWILTNYGSPYLGYGPGEFNGICNCLRALAIVGDIPDYISVNGIATNFPSIVSTFLFLRWDAYNGGFASDLYYGHGVPGRTPREITASVEATYRAVKLMNEPGLNLFTPDGPYNPNADAYAGLCARSQTDYGYFKESPDDNGNPDFQVDVNYYAVSLLTLVNRTNILDEGHFRWPSGAQTPVENLAETGYLLPLIAVIAILPILTAALLEYRLYQRTHSNNPDQNSTEAKFNV